MIYLLFALLGLVGGGLINILADDLLARQRPRLPHCPRCGHPHSPLGWLGLGRWFFQERQCPNCALPTRPRTIAVEIGTALLFAGLPALIPVGADLWIKSFYMAVLILIIVTDLERRLILHIVTFPATLLAFALSNISPTISLVSSLLGALTGLVAFYLLYLLGQVTFGQGALGFGDVTLSMTMGAMLGFPIIIFTLILGILLGGVISIALLATRVVSRHMYLPYGQYLALAGMIMLIWGRPFLTWYLQ